MVELHEEIQSDTRCIVRKGKRMLIDFSNNPEYSSLILHQDLTSSSFLKINCNEDSETIPINLYSASLKAIGLPYTLNGLFTHA